MTDHRYRLASPQGPPKSRAESRRRHRGTLIAGGAAAVLLSLGVAGQAAAAGGTTSQSPGSGVVVEQSAHPSQAPASTAAVERFYDGYITALGEGDTETAEQLRQSHLRADYQEELARWEEQHQADGVLRSQNVPTDSHATYDGSGAGHSWYVVTLTWDGGGSSQLHVQTDTATQKISDIRQLN